MSAYRPSRRKLMSGGIAALGGASVTSAGLCETAAAQGESSVLRSVDGCRVACGMARPVSGPLLPPDLSIASAARRAQIAMGYKAPVEVHAVSTSTAAAVLIPNAEQTGRSRRLVVYNPNYIKDLWRWGGEPALIGLLAHEIAHHANEDLGPDARERGSLARELDADFLAGYALARLGFPAEQSTYAFRYAYAARASATHPDSAARVRSALSGWRLGRATPS
ncbi:MAG: hypothetical protein KTR21_04415 [Rhodobacteraceae bacterium]|nr:hypothetical protein [Paracoccaceae bacterium]